MALALDTTTSAGITTTKIIDKNHSPIFKETASAVSFLVFKYG